MQDIEAAIGGSLDRDGKGGMRASLPMGGHKITGLADGVADSDAATVGQLSGISGVPVGSVIDYAGSTAPTGFLLCYGQAISRSTYAELFAVIGTTYGVGDGSTTFSLPDARGRVSAGKDDMGGTAAGRLTNEASGVTGTTLGASGGAQSVTLTEAQMPSHTHTAPSATIGGAAVSGTAPYAVPGSAVATSSTGGGQAHPNVQPTLILNKIIKATS